MNIFLPSIGKLTLKQSDFLAKGGEATLYTKGSVVFKIFDDQKNLPAKSKLDELKELTNPNIIVPLENVFKANAVERIGFTMRMLNDVYCWAELYPNSFKDKNHFDLKQQLGVIKELQKLIESIHQKNILVVDLNEFNFLVNKDFQQVYAIDVTSYQTKGSPAQVIMPSVRDYRSSSFSENTDWFSWGILTFNLLIGIHPFKGNYDKFANISPDERLKERVVRGVSVFNPEVNIPRICKPFSTIPTTLLNWYKAVFDKGLREKPPSDFFLTHKIPVQTFKVVGSTLKITKIATMSETVWGIHNKIPIFSPFVLGPNFEVIEGKIHKAEIAMKNINFQFDQLIQYNDRLLTKNGGAIYEISFPKNIFSQKHIGNVLDFPHTTKIYSGIIIQNMLGRHFYSIFPHPHTCYQGPLRDFDKSKILRAKFDKRYAEIISFDKEYRRIIFKMENAMLTKIHEEVVDSDAEPNFVVTDGGLYVGIPQDGILRTINVGKFAGKFGEIKDAGIITDMELLTNGAEIFAKYNNELYQIQTG